MLRRVSGRRKDYDRRNRPVVIACLPLSNLAFRRTIRFAAGGDDTTLSIVDQALDRV